MKNKDNQKILFLLLMIAKVNKTQNKIKQNFLKIVIKNKIK